MAKYAKSETIAKPKTRKYEPLYKEIKPKLDNGEIVWIELEKGENAAQVRSGIGFEATRDNCKISGTSKCPPYVKIWKVFD